MNKTDEVEWSIQIAAGAGNFQPENLENHRFILRQHGWLFPSLYIIDHEPIPWN